MKMMILIIANLPDAARNREKSRVHSRVEHMIGVIKLKFGFTKVRYRGLAKNTNRLFATCGLTNLYILGIDSERRRTVALRAQKTTDFRKTLNKTEE